MRISGIAFTLAMALTIFGNACTPAEPASETHSYTLRQAKSAKRGVAQNNWAMAETDIPNLAAGMVWTYNWGSGKPSATVGALLQQSDVEFCPMAWNNRYDEAGLKAAEKWILGFNEPNLTDQCNMTPAQAAEYWPAVVAIAQAAGKKLVSPAMNYGTLEGYHDPVVWLDEFFAQPGISLDDIDAIALHCYMPSAGSVQQFIERFRKYGKPIWLTEFCNGNGSSISETAQLTYLCETLNMLEQHDMVERYAWFMGRGGFNSRWHNNLLDTQAPFGLTNLGKVFVNFPTFDKSIVYAQGEVIPAEQYCYADGPVHLQPSTDGGVLDVTDFKAGCEVRYRVNLPAAGSYKLKIRYQTYMPNTLILGVGDNYFELSLPNSDSSWATESFDIDFPAGAFDLKLKARGNAGVQLNWMMIQ